MNIKEIYINQKEEWNATVKEIPNYDVFYLNEYVSAFEQENQKNGTPILIVYDNGIDKAINVVFRRDIALDIKLKGKIPVNEFYDLITPYGYGGFWGAISNYDALNAAYVEYCKKNKYICEFVRFELFSDYFSHYDGEVETRTHNVVRSLSMSLDDIWMDFKQKVRKNVKRANSNNLKIIIENTEEHLEDFLRIYYSTMDRNSAESDYYFSRDFYHRINDMKDNIMYFHVLHEEKIISTELVIYGTENAYSYLGGTDRKYFNLRPNDFLKYQIIKWCKSIGLKNFVLGGGYGADDGIFQYKTYLAPNGIVDFYVGRNIFDRENYEYLTAIRSKDNPHCKESSFFPQYRA